MSELTVDWSLTSLGLTWQTMDLADSSSLLLSRQSDSEGERCGQRGSLSESVGLHGLSSAGAGPPRHHDTSAGATPTTIARPSFTIVPKLPNVPKTTHAQQRIVHK